MSAKNKRVFKICLFVLIILLILYVLYIAFSIYLYSNIYEKTNADAVIVLGAGVWDNEPSPVFRERINHGIWLYQNGYVGKIIFTGGKGTGNIYSDSFIARKYAMRQGVPLEDILIEEQSSTTQQNIDYASKIMERNHMKTAVIVSDPLHMKRAMTMAKDYGLTAYSSPTPTSKYKTLKTKIPFLIREVYFYIGYIIVGRFAPN